MSVCTVLSPERQLDACQAGLSGAAADCGRGRAEAAGDVIDVREVPNVPRDGPVAACGPELGAHVQKPVGTLSLDDVVEWREVDGALPSGIGAQRRQTRSAECAVPLEPQTS